jgi:hypothetical protein
MKKPEYMDEVRRIAVDSYERGRIDALEGFLEGLNSLVGDREVSFTADQVRELVNKSLEACRAGKK